MTTTNTLQSYSPRPVKIGSVESIEYATMLKSEKNCLHCLKNSLFICSLLLTCLLSSLDTSHITHLQAKVGNFAEKSGVLFF